MQARMVQLCHSPHCPGGKNRTVGHSYRQFSLKMTNRCRAMEAKALAPPTRLALGVRAEIGSGSGYEIRKDPAGYSNQRNLS